MRRFPRVRTAALIGILLSGPVGLMAQGRFEVGALVGIYAPTADYPAARYYSTALPNSPQDLTGVALGVQARFWALSNLGVQLDGAVSSSSVGGGNGPNGPLSSRSARVTIATAQVMLATHLGRSRLWLSTGVGRVRYGGNAYTPYFTRTGAALVAGMGSTIPLRSHVNLTAGLTAFSYRLSVNDSAGVSMMHGRQIDLRLQTGVTWTW